MPTSPSRRPAPGRRVRQTHRRRCRERRTPGARREQGRHRGRTGLAIVLLVVSAILMLAGGRALHVWASVALIVSCAILVVVILLRPFAK